MWLAHDGSAFVECAAKTLRFGSELRGGTLILLRQVYAPTAMRRVVKFATRLQQAKRVWDVAALEEFYRDLQMLTDEMGVQQTMMV